MNLLILYLPKQPDNSIVITSFFKFIYTWNYGISFGMFSQYLEYSNYILLVLNSLIIMYLMYILLNTSRPLSIISFNLIIGGAIGNLVDRVLHGAVFDFIYFHYQNYSFPAFNLADSFITIGAILFCYDYFIGTRTLR